MSVSPPMTRARARWSIHFTIASYYHDDHHIFIYVMVFDIKDVILVIVAMCLLLLMFAQFDQMVDQIYHLEAGDTLEVVAALPEGCAAHHILSLTIPTSNSINQSCNHTINPSLNQLSIQ